MLKKQSRVFSFACFCVVLIVHLPVGAEDTLYSAFQNPPVEARPFVRWWWNDNRVTAKEIARELDVMQAAGIGGVEINPIALQDQYPKPGKPLVWLSPEWNQMVKVAVEEAKARDMVADLIVGTGWPFGGEFLQPGQLNQALELHHQVVSGPQTLTLRQAELLAPTVRHWKSRGGHGQAPQLRFLRLVPADIRNIEEVMDYSQAFDEDGSIQLSVPAGKHILYTGAWKEGYRTVVGGAAGGAGPVMDHFDEAVVTQYLERMSAALGPALGGTMGQGLRAMFCDSIELAGANWSDDMLVQFQQRRGYDLDPYLPFVLVNEGVSPDNTLHPAFKDTIYRVRYDFSLTLVEMFLERFTSTFYSWCHDNGMLCRYQAYGTPWLMGLSEGYLIPDIPESNNWLNSRDPYDHGYWVWHKYCSSSGHLAGRRIISNEAMTNTQAVFQATLEMFKHADDMNFIQGMNHSVLHGFNYSPPEAGFPGWVRYGTYFSEQNTWWPHFRKWADYNARLSAVFQQATPKGQCAILAPAADLWSEYSLIRDRFHVTPWYCHRLWEPLQQSGYAADYLSERVIQKAEVKEGRLVYGPMGYEVLILADVKSLQPATARAIQGFVHGGGTLLVIGEKPQRSPSFKDAQENDRQVRRVMKPLSDGFKEQVHWIPAPKPGRDLLPVMNAAMNTLHIKPQVNIITPHPKVYQVYYEDQGRPVVFFSNQDSLQPAAIEVDFEFEHRVPWCWDPESGKRQPFACSDKRIHLAPQESLLLVFEKGSTVDTRRSPCMDRQSAQALECKWTLTLKPAHGRSTSHQLDTLLDLGLSSDPVFNRFAGTAVYTTTFELDQKGLRFLNLGEVHGISKVKLNGKELGLCWWGEPVYDTSGMLKQGRNELEVQVVTVLSNYCRTLKDDPSAKRWASKHKPVSTGLVGPVTLHEKSKMNQQR